MSELANTDVNETVDEALPPVSIFDVCGTDTESAENGKWFKGEEIWPRGAGIRLRIRRLASKTSVKVRAELMTKYAKYQTKKGTFPEEIDERMLYELLARAIIVDWSGVLDKDGKEIPFTFQAAYTLCEKLPDFRSAVITLAGDMDQFRAEEEEAVAGN